MSDTAPKKAIRDKAFAKRLEQSIIDHPRSPDGSGPRSGNQKWLREQLEQKFNHKISPEGVRRYLAGEMRPKPKVMSMIAQLLEVDEAWLSLGINPTMRPAERRRHDAMAEGAVNLLAGMIQMAGGTIAYPTKDAEKDVDLFAIIQGVQCRIEVKSIRPKGDGPFEINLPSQIEDLIVILVVAVDGVSVFNFVRVPTDVIKARAESRGGYLTLSVEMKNHEYRVAGEPLPRITDFTNLEGQVITGKVPQNRMHDPLKAVRRGLDLD